MAEKDTIDQPRYARWVNASHSLDHVLPGAATVIQGLGKLDAKLVREDTIFQELSVEVRGSVEESLKLTERFTLSHLWVLGAYEVVRRRMGSREGWGQVLQKDGVRSCVLTGKRQDRTPVPRKGSGALGSRSTLGGQAMTPNSALLTVAYLALRATSGAAKRGR